MNNRKEIQYTKRELKQQSYYCVINKSSIHGLGLFARRSIPAGIVIGYYKGIELNNDIDDDTYIHWWKGRLPIEVLGDTKYMNHSSDPNCRIKREDRDPESRYRSVIISRRRIKKGEELTRYYSDYFDNLISGKG